MSERYTVHASIDTKDEKKASLNNGISERINRLYTENDEVLNIPIRFINSRKQDDFYNFYSLKRDDLKESMWYRMPLINVFYDEFIDEDYVTNEYIMGFLEMVGLLTALFLSAVAAIPMSVDFEELDAARKRFASDPYLQTRWGGNDTIMYELSAYSTCAIYMLGTAVSLIIFFFFFSGMNNYNDENTPGKIRKEWWKYHKIIIIFIFLSSLCGMVSSFLAMNRFGIIKFPDLYVEKACRYDRNGTCTGGNREKFPSGFDSAYGAYLTWGYFYMVCSLFLSWLIHSAARARQGTVGEKVYQHYNAKLKGWNRERKKILVYFGYLVKRWDLVDNLP